MPGAPDGQKMTSDTLELVIRGCKPSVVSAGNQTQVNCKSNKFF